MTQKRKDTISNYIDLFSTSLSFIELISYIGFDDNVQLDANQYVGNTQVVLEKISSVLQKIPTMDTSNTTLDGITNFLKKSIKDKNIFLGTLLDAYDNKKDQINNAKKEEFLLDILGRNFYKQFIKTQLSSNDDLSEDDFMAILLLGNKSKHKIGNTDIAKVKLLRTILNKDKSAILKTFKDDIPRAIDATVGTVNTVNNLLNSLSDKDSSYDALVFLATQHLTAQAKAMLKDGTSYTGDAIATWISKKVASKLVPGVQAVTLAKAGVNLGNFAYDAASAPKYIPFSIEYDGNDIEVSQPDSASFVTYSYLEQLESSQNAYKLLSDQILDRDDDALKTSNGVVRYDITDKPAILMKKNAVFYHQMLIGSYENEVLTKAFFENHKKIKVGIKASNAKKGDLLITKSGESLPRTDIDASDHIETKEINGEQFTYINFKNMFYDAENSFLQSISGIRENQTYYKLLGDDTYTLSSIVEFTDFDGKTKVQSEFSGSTFSKSHLIYMPNTISGNDFSFTIYEDDDVSDFVKFDIFTREEKDLYVYLYDDELMDCKLVDKSLLEGGAIPSVTINNSNLIDSQWVENGKLSRGKIVVFDRNIHNYLIKSYGDDTYKKALAIKFILEDQGSENYILEYSYTNSKVKYKKSDFVQGITIDELENSEVVTVPAVETESSIVIHMPDSATINGSTITATQNDEIILTFDKNYHSRDNIVNAKDLEQPYKIWYTQYDYVEATFDTSTYGLKFNAPLTGDFTIQKIQYPTEHPSVPYATTGVPESFVMVDSSTLSNSSNTQESVNLSNGLVAHYEFEDNANDSSGNVNHGTEYGGVTYSDGVIGKALSLDGVDDYIDIDNSVLSDTGSFSVFIKPHTLDTSSQTDGISNIISNFKANVTNGGSRLYLIQENEQLKYGIGSIGSSNSIYTLNLNEWLHIYAEWVNGTYKIYINNTLADTASFDGYPIQDEFGLGSFINLLKNFYDGSLDDFRLYNRALNESEIQELYNLGQQNTTTTTEVNQVDMSTYVSNGTDSIEVKMDLDLDSSYNELILNDFTIKINIDGTAKISNIFTADTLEEMNTLIDAGWEKVNTNDGDFLVVYDGSNQNNYIAFLVENAFYTGGFNFNIVVDGSISSSDNEWLYGTIKKIYLHNISDKSTSSETITHNGYTYNTVTSPYTGRVWLDRNLGASQVCTSATDSNCYGDYYQWGRNTDGHEKSNSATISTQATDIITPPIN